MGPGSGFVSGSLIYRTLSGNKVEGLALIECHCSVDSSAVWTVCVRAVRTPCRKLPGSALTRQHGYRCECTLKLYLVYFVVAMSFRCNDSLPMYSPSPTAAAGFRPRRCSRRWGGLCMVQSPSFCILAVPREGFGWGEVLDIPLHH